LIPYDKLPNETRKKRQMNKIKIIVFIALVIITNIKVEPSYALVLTVGNQDEQYTSIQEAIDSSSEYDMIYLSDGIYREQIVIKEKSNLVIIGNGDVVLRSNKTSEGTAISLINSNNIKVIGLTVEDFEYGILGNNLEDILIFDNNFLKNGNRLLPTGCTQNNPYKNCSSWNDNGSAISIANSKNVEISANAITEGERGILIFDSLGNIDINNNAIQNNQQYGIRLNNAGSDIKLVNNRIVNNFGKGIEIYTTNNSFEEDLMITNNQIHGNYNDGLKIENQRNFVISYNTIIKNSFTDMVPYHNGIDLTYGGLYINRSTNGLINNNDFSENGDYGSYLDSQASNIKFQFNIFNNHLISPQSYDSGSFNSYDQNNLGNFWSDRDNTTSNIYTLNGTSIGRDNYPLSSLPKTVQSTVYDFRVSKIEPEKISFTWSNRNEDSFKENILKIKNIKNGDISTYDQNDFPGLAKYSYTNLDINSLENDTSYEVVLISYLNDNTYNESNIVYFDTLYSSNLPLAPSIISLNSLAKGVVYLSWFPAKTEENVSFYEIYRKANDQSFEYIRKVMSPNTFYYDIGVSSNDEYSYKIRAKNTTGYSFFSPEIKSKKNSQITFNSENSINIFNSSVIENTTIVATTPNKKAELVFTEEVIKKSSANDIVISSFNASIKSDLIGSHDDYAFVSNDNYYFTLSDSKSKISLDNLPTPAIISIKYLEKDLSGASENQLSIQHFDYVKKQWLPLLTEVNPNTNVLTAKTRYLGLFRIMHKKTAMNFHDLDYENWAYGYVQNLNRSGIITGYTDNTFRPEYNALRAEVVKMVLQANGYKLPIHVFEKPCNDISLHEWYAPYFLLAKSLSLISGYDNNICKPTQPITRIEALKIIIGEEGESYYNKKVNFKDSDDIPAWANSYINYAVDQGIINGYSDNTFRPNQFISRQELAKILYEKFRLIK
jgi:hypothetical protein